MKKPPAVPRPVPPDKPDPADCCRGGCDPCIFELYAEQVRRYREALAAWDALNRT